MPDHAHPASASLRPLPEKASTLNYNVVFTKAEFAIMRRGLVPTNVDVKWLVICEGQTLFFHRSWTGHCIYRLDLAPRGGKYYVVRALANRDPKEYTQQNNEYDTRMLHFVIRGILLGEKVPFPLAPTPTIHSAEALGRDAEPTLPVPEPVPPERPWWRFW
jgi:hypothetical protein